jgi:hypothetical protein
MIQPQRAPPIERPHAREFLDLQQRRVRHRDPHAPDTHGGRQPQPLPASRYSSVSGFNSIRFPPAAFFSQYFFIHASQFFPAAVSRPVNASAAMSA